MSSNIVEVFMHFWTELRGVKRVLVTVRGNITVFRGTFKFDNFYFIYHIEAIIRSTFLRFLPSNSAPQVCTAPYPSCALGHGENRHPSLITVYYIHYFVDCLTHRIGKRQKVSRFPLVLDKLVWISRVLLMYTYKAF